MIAGPEQMQRIAKLGRPFAPPDDPHANLCRAKSQTRAPQRLRDRRLSRDQMQMRQCRAGSKRRILTAFRRRGRDPARPRGDRKMTV